MKSRKIMKYLLAAIFVLCGQNIVIAEEPLDLFPGAPGTLGLVTYYTHVTANEYYMNGNKVSSDFNLKADLGVFRGVYYGKIGDIRTCTNLIVPFGSQSLDTTLYTPGSNLHLSSQTGLGDIIFNTGAYLFYNEKTMTSLPISLYVTAPTGAYEHERSLNIGANRWAVKPSIGFAKGIGSWGTLIETVAQAEFYTTNRDYTSASLDLKKDPLYGFQVMLTQFLSPKTFISADYFFEYGGETEVAGIKQNDETRTHALQFALAHMITENTQIMFRYRKDVDVENGPKNDLFQVRLGFLIPDFGKMFAKRD